MLIIHKSAEVNIDGPQKYKEVYYLDIVDYKDPVTDNFSSFDIYMKELTIYIDKGSLLRDKPISQKYLIVDSIIKNTIDSSNEAYAKLTFKLNPDGETITVTYVSLTDCLSVFVLFIQFLL
jgi:hypothetical protein